MNAVMNLERGNPSGLYELNENEIDSISGGNPVLVVAGAAIAVGVAAVDFGYKLGGMLYKALH